MSIKTKLIISTIISTFGLCVMVLMSNLSLNSLSKLDETRTEVEVLKSDMLMLRRNEKDFLLRQDLKYVVQHKQGMVKLLLNINNSNISEIKKLKVTVLIQQYKVDFNALVHANIMIGLTHHDGYHGEMRSAVKSTEQLFVDLEHYIKREIETAKQQASIFSEVASLVIAGFITFMLFLVSKSITVRLDSVIRHMAKIASGAGDLTVKLN